MKATEGMIDAAAESLWLSASKERFGPWSEVKDDVKKLWRKDAAAALAAAFKNIEDVVYAAINDSLGEGGTKEKN